MRVALTAGLERTDGRYRTALAIAEQYYPPSSPASTNLKKKKADTCLNRPTLPMQYTERRFLAAIATAMYATQYGQNEMISLIKQDLNVQATYVKKIFSSIEFL